MVTSFTVNTDEFRQFLESTRIPYKIPIKKKTHFQFDNMIFQFINDTTILSHKMTPDISVTAHYKCRISDLKGDRKPFAVSIPSLIGGRGGGIKRHSILKYMSAETIQIIIRHDKMIIEFRQLPDEEKGIPKQRITEGLIRTKIVITEMSNDFEIDSMESFLEVSRRRNESFKLLSTGKLTMAHNDFKEEEQVGQFTMTTSWVDNLIEGLRDFDSPSLPLLLTEKEIVAGFGNFKNPTGQKRSMQTAFPSDWSGDKLVIDLSFPKLSMLSHHIGEEFTAHIYEIDLEHLSEPFLIMFCLDDETGSVLILRL